MRIQVVQEPMHVVSLLCEYRLVSFHWLKTKARVYAKQGCALVFARISSLFYVFKQRIKASHTSFVLSFTYTNKEGTRAKTKAQPSKPFFVLRSQRRLLKIFDKRHY